MAIVKANGKKVPASTMKKVIMEANGWNAEQYRKKYDLFKNKLRAYENFRKAHGADLEPQSPQEILYRQAKAKKREGEAYKPSREMERIMGFSAVSITKGKKLAEQLNSKYSKKRMESFAATTREQFKQLINDVPMAKRIDEEIADPVKKEEALKALAEHIHAKQKPSGEVFAGETYGSDEAGEDFNISQWLD